MKALTRAAICVAAYIGIVAAFELVVIVGALLQVKDIGVPVLVITTTAADASTNDRVLARIENGGELFVSANHWPRAWHDRALENPNVQVTLDGETSDYLAVPATPAELARIDRENGLPLIVRFLTGFPPRAALRLEPR